MAKGERIAGIEARDAVRAGNRAERPVRAWTERACANCGKMFHVQQGPGQHRRFCPDGTDKCATRFRARCSARGKIIVPLALAWRVSRGKKGTVGAQAHAELIAVLDAFAAEDRAAGRPKMDDYVASTLAGGFRYVDRKKR